MSARHQQTHRRKRRHRPTKPIAYETRLKPASECADRNEPCQSDSAQARIDLAAGQAASAHAVSDAQEDAAKANRHAQQADSDKAEMRARLSTQLNLILQTRDSARGLIVNMSDVLFDTGKYSLKPGAREKLAKVAGILLAYPGINVQVGGYTDNVGSDDMNQVALRTPRRFGA